MYITIDVYVSVYTNISMYPNKVYNISCICRNSGTQDMAEVKENRAIAQWTDTNSVG